MSEPFPSSDKNNTKLAPPDLARGIMVISKILNEMNEFYEGVHRKAQEQEVECKKLEDAIHQLKMDIQKYQADKE